MQIANRYDVQNELGQGGMGVVYQVRDRLTRKSLALKRVNATPSDLRFNSKTDGNMLMALAREFRILAGLRHPNIIPVLDYGFDSEKRPFFTMELLESPQEFFDVTKNASLKELVNLFVQLLQALSYLHQRGIIHRDLKPGNVLIQNHQVYVLDFGLSEIADVAQGRAGTIEYMAPEVMRKGLATTQSDLFAAGVMLYKAITGDLPFGVHAIMGAIPLVLDDGRITDHPLELVIQRLLSEQPSDRYPSARDVIEALCDAAEIDPPEEDPRIRESFLLTAPFVGRETELTQLENAFQAANAGQGSIWLIGGESGVGKSRLMDEIRVRALIDGAIVVRGQAVEGGLPYQMLRDPLRRLILSIELDDLSAGVLQEIVPDISDLLARDIQAAPQLDTTAQQQRLIATMIDVFKKQTQAVLLILEDLQWATESLDLLKHISQFINQHKLLLLTNYRDDERPDLPELIPGSKVMKLARLSETEISQLSVSMIGDRGNQTEVLQLLQRETEGNAFFLVEVVRALAEAAGSRSQIGQATLPEAVFSGGIETIIQRRLDKIPEHYHPILMLVAVAGRQLDPALLSTMIAEDDFEDFIQKGADAAVFDIQDGQWQFSHDKLREYILSSLSDKRKMLLNQQVAEAIETVYPDELDDYAARLSKHWHESGQAEKELYYIQIAGEQAAATSSYRESITYFERALSLYSNQPEAQANTYIQMGLSLSRLGFNDPAKDAVRNALALLEWSSNIANFAEAMNVMGCILRDEGKFDDALSYFEKSLQVARRLHEDELVARTLLDSGWLEHRRALYENAYERFSEAVDIYERLNDNRGLAKAYNRLGGAALKLGDYQASTILREKSIELCRISGDRWGESSALANLGETARLQKNYDLARDYYLDALDINRSIDTPQLTSIVLSNLAYVESATENYSDALPYYAQSLDIALEIKATHLVLHNLVGIAGVKTQIRQIRHGVEILQSIINHPALMGESKNNVDAIIAALPHYIEFEANPDTVDLESLAQEILEELEV